MSWCCCWALERLLETPVFELERLLCQSLRFLLLSLASCWEAQPRPLVSRPWFCWCLQSGEEALPSETPRPPGWEEALVASLSSVLLLSPELWRSQRRASGWKSANVSALQPPAVRVLLGMVVEVVVGAACVCLVWSGWDGGELVDFRQSPCFSCCPDMAKVWESVCECCCQALLLNEVGLMSSLSLRP